jgi:hypothetical protein
MCLNKIYKITKTSTNVNVNWLIKIKRTQIVAF